VRAFAWDPVIGRKSRASVAREKNEAKAVHWHSKRQTKFQADISKQDAHSSVECDRMSVLKMPLPKAAIVLTKVGFTRDLKQQQKPVHDWIHPETEVRMGSQVQ